VRSDRRTLNDDHATKLAANGSYSAPKLGRARPGTSSAMIAGGYHDVPCTRCTGVRAMNEKARENRRDLEALERFLDERAQGIVRDLDEFAAGGPERAEDAARARRAAGLGSTVPDPDSAPASLATPTPEGVLGGYRLVRELGRGGQGEVWLAEDGRLRRKVALKILHRGVETAEDALIRFGREAELASRLDHPGLCAVYAMGREHGRAWIAMRFVEGETLARLLDRAAAPPRTREEIDAWVLLIEKAARAAHVAHEAGVVHRDLKPTNVIVTKDGEPVIVDFGLARGDDAERATLTSPGAVFGTAAYMAPEQLTGAPLPADRRADVYALAAVLFQATTGRPLRPEPTFAAIRAAAFTPPPRARSLNPALTRDLEAVLSVALEPDLARRYRTALAFAEDLRRVREGEPIAARPAGPLTRLRAWARRERALAAATALIVASLAGGFAASFLFWRDAADLNDELVVSLGAVRSLADVRAVRSLIDRETNLWPVGPALTASCRSWLDDARAVLSRVSIHRAALDRVRAAPVDANDATPTNDSRAWEEEVLVEILKGTDAIAARVASVEERLRRSETLEERTLGGANAETWRRCVEAVKKSPRYGGLDLKPQVGLVPLGESATTGLWEFWHVESGAAPRFDEEADDWALAEGGGVVLVLMPGGRALIGAHEADSLAMNDHERPAQEARLDAYFFGKYEITQDQWMRGDEGRNPSHHVAGAAAASQRVVAKRVIVTVLHPAENVAWSDAKRWAARAGLSLPTEARWEAACRFDVDAAWPWSTGSAAESLKGAANVAGAERAEGGIAAPFNDGFEIHAPVGTFEPSPAGLYDLHGNVGEWCLDAAARSPETGTPRPGDGLREPAWKEHTRVVRGGSFWFAPAHCRCGTRAFSSSGGSGRDIGFRACRSVE
jgi:formylglycine-generating enzyme required for sulfatase activity/predicted Ser/Thr protein kinase